MLRIVGVQRSENAQEEFVLLQNQGHMRLVLKGHALVGESAIAGAHPGQVHLFSEDVSIPAGKYVLVSTGSGEPHWARSRDGADIFHTYMNQTSGVWIGGALPLHVLSVNHSYSGRFRATADIDCGLQPVSV